MAGEHLNVACAEKKLAGSFFFFFDPYFWMDSAALDFLFYLNLHLAYLSLYIGLPLSTPFSTSSNSVHLYDFLSRTLSQVL